MITVVVIYRVTVVTLMFFGLVVALDESTWTADHGINESSPASSMENQRRKAAKSKRRLEGESSITFLATTNTDLTPSRIEDATGRKLNSVDSMLRSTSAYKATYKTGYAAPRGQTINPFDLPPPVQIIRGSSEDDPDLRSSNVAVLSVEHGLISAAVDAYNNHLNLALRPDDIWIAILTQFASYVNGGNRAELLRSRLVTFDGQKKVEVQGPGDVFTADFGGMTLSMLEKMREYFVDAALYEWFLPGFTTSTPTDRVCAAACAMCTTQKFFSFGFLLGCGIPQVILEGSVEDWRKLRSKMDKLKEFDAGDGELIKWVGFLEVILDNFVKSAESGSDENLEFWDTIAHYIGGASATEYLSGWVTTFSYFSDDGLVTPTSVNSTDLAVSIDVMRNSSPKDAARFDLYEQEYKTWPIIDSEKLASGIVSCPIRINDRGTPYDARLFVGQMALNYMRATKSMKEEAVAVHEDRRGKLRVIRPRNDWAIGIEGPSTVQ